VTNSQWVFLVWSIASLAIYIGCGIWLARKAKKLPLVRDEEQADQRSQRQRH